MLKKMLYVTVCDFKRNFAFQGLRWLWSMKNEKKELRLVPCISILLSVIYVTSYDLKQAIIGTLENYFIT